MNIESKKYHVKGAGLANMVNIRDKSTGSTAIVTNAPSHSVLAAMPEAIFDKQCKASMAKGEWDHA